MRFRTCIVVCFLPVAIMLLDACGKGKGVTPSVLSPLDSTHNLARTWQIIGYEDSNQIDISDTTYALPDTTVSIIVVNDSTLSVDGNVLNYISYSSNDSMLYFWYVTKPPPYWAQMSVSYYFLKDSIVFDQFKLAGPNNGYVELRYHSY